MLNVSSGCDYLMYTRAFLTIKTCPFLIYPKIAVYADFKNIYFAILLNNKFVCPAYNLSLACQTQIDGMFPLSQGGQYFSNIVQFIIILLIPFEVDVTSFTCYYSKS